MIRAMRREILQDGDFFSCLVLSWDSINEVKSRGKVDVIKRTLRKLGQNLISKVDANKVEICENIESLLMEKKAVNWANWKYWTKLACITFWFTSCWQYFENSDPPRIVKNVHNSTEVFEMEIEKDLIFDLFWWFRHSSGETNIHSDRKICSICLLRSTKAI